MSIPWRALPAWPYPEQDAEKDLFEAGFTDTMNLLEREIAMVNGRDAVIGVVTYQNNIGKSGSELQADSKLLHHGAEVSFDRPVGKGWQRVTFHTDARRSYVDRRRNFNGNLRAIAKGLEALRAVNRFGIATTGQQYAGFAQLSAGPGLEELGKELVERFGGINEALRATHPDTGGPSASARDFQAVVAFRKATEG